MADATPPEAAGASAPTPEHPVLAAVAAAVPSARWSMVRGDHVVEVSRDDYRGLVEALEAAGFEVFADLCGVDYLRRPEGRFEVVVNLVSHAHRLRVRVRCAVPGDDPVLASIAGIYPGANFYEREAYDLFGIRFDGHPDLTRILLPDDWVGHPLRKDEPVGAVPVQFKGAHQVE